MKEIIIGFEVCNWLCWGTFWVGLKVRRINFIIFEFLDFLSFKIFINFKIFVGNFKFLKF